MERYDQQNAAQGAEAAARQVSDSAKSGMNELAQKGRETANKLGAALNTAKTRIQESTTAGARATDQIVRDHPYEAIGVAFGVGVLIGVLINRK
jgi:ElaB/YqjD/DUF883 family membrane-anchored ribosome-binding protein